MSVAIKYHLERALDERGGSFTIQQTGQYIFQAAIRLRLRKATSAACELVLDVDDAPAYVQLIHLADEHTFDLHAQYHLEKGPHTWSVGIRKRLGVPALLPDDRGREDRVELVGMRLILLGGPGESPNTMGCTYLHHDLARAGS